MGAHQLSGFERHHPADQRLARDAIRPQAFLHVAAWRCLRRSSFLCGLAPSLGVLVFFRILQGAGGGGLQPSEQAILADTFPPAKRGMAFAVYGMAVVVAPAIGPTLGGWITDNYSWRWIFYINVPISIISLYLTHSLVEDPPYLKAEQSAARVDRASTTSASALVALGIGCLADRPRQRPGIGLVRVALDHGGCRLLAVVLLVIWVIWEWHHPHPIVELKLLKNRNFATAVFFMFVLGFVLYGTTVSDPAVSAAAAGVLRRESAGEALAGGGFIMMLMMPLSGVLVVESGSSAM